MKITKIIKYVASFLGILVPMFFGFAVWEKLPEKIPIHYNFKGVPDNFADKWVGVVILPIALCFVQILCLALSRIIDKRHFYGMGAVLMICPFVSILVSMPIYMTSFGKDYDMATLILCGIGLLFAVIGNILPKVSRNKVMGIKLPWTLKSDVVWNKTHRLSGFLWFFGGLLIAVSAFLPDLARIILSSCIFVAMIAVPTVYSAVIFKKEKEKIE